MYLWHSHHRHLAISSLDTARGTCEGHTQSPTTPLIQARLSLLMLWLRVTTRNQDLGFLGRNKLNFDRNLSNSLIFSAN